MKWIILLTVILFFIPSLVSAEDHYVTQDGGSGSMSVADFNDLLGTGYAGDTFYFSGTITSEVTPGISGTSGEGYVTLDGYETGDCDPINSACSGSALIDRNDPGDGSYYGIETNNQDYLVIQDFRITDCSSCILSIYPSTSDHIVIKRNHISYCRGAGIYSGGESYWTIGGALGDGNVIYNIGEGGTPSAPAGLRFYHIDDLIASYNHIYNDDETYGYPIASDGIVVMSSNRHLYEYNTIHDQGEDCIDWKGWSQYLILRFNDFYNTYEAPCKIQRGTNYAYVYGNRFYNANEPSVNYHGFLIYRGADQVKAWANLIYNNRGSGLAIFKDSDDPSGIDDSIFDGIVFYNNIVTENVRDGDHNYHCGTYLSLDGDITMKNNIFSRNVWGGDAYRQIYASSMSNIDMDYNLFYYDSSHNPTIRVGGTYYTLTDPVSGTSFNSATGQEDHGAVGDPLFIDVTGRDFRLQSDSPAINTGADLSGPAGSMQVQGVTYDLYYDDCLDPDNTDWGTIPPTVATVKQSDHGSGWERGAYIYTEYAPQTCQDRGFSCCIACEPGTGQPDYDYDCPGVEMCCGGCVSGIPELPLAFFIPTPSTAEIAGRYVLDTDILATSVGSLKRYPSLFTDLPRGKRQIGSVSPDDFIENMDLINSINPEYLAYDIEHGTATPEELADPVGAVESMYNFAHENGFKLIAGTDLSWLNELGAQMAQHADEFVVQCGGAQLGNPEDVCGKTVPCTNPTDPDTCWGPIPSCTPEENLAYFTEDCPRRINIIKNAEDIPVTVQLSTYPSVTKVWGRLVTLEEMKAATYLISDMVDGVSIYHIGAFPETTELWEEYLQWMRSETCEGEYNYSIIRTPYKPVIDADLSDFADADTVTVTDPTTGTTGTYRLMWDDQAIYIAAEFSDSALNTVNTENDRYLWQDDGLEIMFDTLNDGGDTSPHIDDYKFYAIPSGAYADSQAYNLDWDTRVIYAVSVDGTVNDNSDADTGYMIEMEIPWQDWEIAEPDFEPAGFGSVWGMNIQLNDMTATGKSSTQWSESGLSVNIPDGWNDVLFTVRADTSRDGCVHMDELVPFIDSWKYDSTTYPMREMMEAVVLYYSPGAGC